MFYICGNYSSILSYLDRRFKELLNRRRFTVFLLMTILIVHDAMPYEDALEMAEYISQAMKQATRKAVVLLFTMSGF